MILTELGYLVDPQETEIILAANNKAWTSLYQIQNSYEQ